MKHNSTTTKPSDKKCLCFQVGARENYEIPRMLHQHDLLDSLYTDIWLSPVAQKLWPRKYNLRFHHELRDAQVFSFNPSILSQAIKHKLTLASYKTQTMEQNLLFQQQAIAHLTKYKKQLEKNPGYCVAYSYAALGIIKFLKDIGWKILLMQSNLGKMEEELVLNLAKEFPQYNCTFKPSPPEYWDDWKKECDITDIILVNSEWAKQGVIKHGIEKDKIEILPLTLENKIQGKNEKNYPPKFDSKTPLTILFVGQVCLRKGVHLIFETQETLKDQPVEFLFAGDIEITIPKKILNDPKFTFLKKVPHSMLDHYYRKAHILLLPTISDGFALVQLEAFSANLPIIASKNCASIVTDKHNGHILETLTPEAIASKINLCLNDPYGLAEMSKQCHIPEKNTRNHVCEKLFNITDKLTT